MAANFQKDMNKKNTSDFFKVDYEGKLVDLLKTNPKKAFAEIFPSEEQLLEEKYVDTIGKRKFEKIKKTKLGELVRKFNV